MTVAAASHHVQRKREARREAILRAAIREFARNGYERTTMQDIAAALDMTSASLYYYYSSKDGLLFAALDSTLGRLIKALELAVRETPDDRTPGDPAAALKRLVFAHVTFELEDPTAGPLVNTHLYGPRYLVDMLDGAAQAELRQKQRAIYRLYRTCVDRLPGIAASDAALLTFDLLALAQYPVVWFRPGGMLGVEDVAARQADLAGRLLARDG
jgi:AcrR family transcriptional regulator